MGRGYTDGRSMLCMCVCVRVKKEKETTTTKKEKKQRKTWQMLQIINAQNKINNSATPGSHTVSNVLFQSRVECITFNTTQILHWLWQRNNLHIRAQTLQRTIHQIQPSTFEQTTLVHYTRQRHGPSLIFRHNSAQNQQIVVRCTIWWTPHKLWFPFIQIHTAQSTASLHSDRNTSTHTWSFVTWQQPLQSIWIWKWGLVFPPTSYVFLWFLLSLFHVVSSCCTVADDQSYFLEISLCSWISHTFST